MWFVQFFAVPLVFGYRKLIKPTGIRAYLTLFSLKKEWRSLWHRSHNVFLNLINHRAVIYLLVAGLAVLIVTHNIHAKEISPEDLGSSSIIFQLVASDEGLTIIEDTTPPKVSTAPQEDFALTADQEMIPENNEEQTLSLIEEGSALIATSDTETPRTRTQVEDYTIQPGDTATSIARQFGLTVNTILWANKLGKYTIIRPGDTIKIPPVSGVLYTVKKGDTVEGIAKKYQANTSDIMEANRLAGAQLASGKEIIIPGGVPPAPQIKRPERQFSVTNILHPNAKDTGGSRLLWPVISRRINQYYSWRHQALDIDGNIGQPIYAAESGKVERSGWNGGGYGYYIIINHGNGMRTLYAHNSKNLVRVGEAVSRGQVIGLIGSTGRSTGPHVHFEVRVSNRKMNPFLYTK